MAAQPDHVESQVSEHDGVAVTESAVDAHTGGPLDRGGIVGSGHGDRVRMGCGERGQRTDVIVVGILIYALLGLLSDTAVRRLEARVLSYRRSLGS